MFWEGDCWKSFNYNTCIYTVQTRHWSNLSFIVPKIIFYEHQDLNLCTILIHIHCDKYLAFHYSFKTFLSQVVVLLIFYKLLQCCWVNWDIQIFYTISTLLGSYKFVITKFYQLSFQCWVTVYKELFTAFGVTRIKWQPNITTVILFIKLMLCY